MYARKYGICIAFFLRKKDKCAIGDIQILAQEEKFYYSLKEQGVELLVFAHGRGDGTRPDRWLLATPYGGEESVASVMRRYGVKTAYVQACESGLVRMSGTCQGRVVQL